MKKSLGDLQAYMVILLCTTLFNDGMSFND